MAGQFLVVVGGLAGDVGGSGWPELIFCSHCCGRSTLDQLGELLLVQATSAACGSVRVCWGRGTHHQRWARFSDNPQAPC